MHRQLLIERRSEPIPLSEDARSAQTRLFFGGSFDPPHIGHALLPSKIARRHDNARVIYVPAARSPFKSVTPTVNHHRINMLTIAIQASESADIWTQELRDAKLNPSQPSYWADTWSIVRRMNLPGTNRFLIGADQMLSMHRWRRYTEFWQDAIVMLRQNDQTDDQISNKALIDQLCSLGVWNDQELSHWADQIIPIDTLDCSSTAIRDALSTPSTRNNPIDGLDSGVAAYIREHGLYS